MGASGGVWSIADKRWLDFLNKPTDWLVLSNTLEKKLTTQANSRPQSSIELRRYYWLLQTIKQQH